MMFYVRFAPIYRVFNAIRSRSGVSVGGRSGMRIHLRLRPHEKGCTAMVTRAFSNLPIGAKILSGVLVACLGAVAITIVSMISMGDLRGGQEELRNEALDPVLQFSEVRHAYLQARIDSTSDAWVPSGNDAERDAYLADAKEMDGAITKLAAIVTTDKQRASIADLDNAWTAYDKIIQSNELRDLGRAGDRAGYIAVRNAKIKPLATRLQLDLAATIADTRDNVDISLAEAKSSYDSSRVLLIVVSGLAVLAATGFALLAARGVTRPLRQVSSALESVSRGDLTMRVDVRSTDEVGRMAESLNKATESMSQTVGGSGGGGG